MENHLRYTFCTFLVTPLLKPAVILGKSNLCQQVHQLTKPPVSSLKSGIAHAEDLEIHEDKERLSEKPKREKISILQEGLELNKVYIEFICKTVSDKN